MLTAAANPHSEAPEVIIQTLPVEQRSSIAVTQQAIGTQFSDRVKRGSIGLAEIDNAEWNRLVDEAANSP